MKTVLLVIFVFYSLSINNFAQNKYVLKPIATTIISKNHPRGDVIVEKNIKNKYSNQRKDIQKAYNHFNGVNTLDTLSYRRLFGGNWNVNFGVFGQEYIIMWFEAPADLTIKEVGVAFAENLNNVGGSLKLYEVENSISVDDLLNVGPNEVKQGRFKSADSTYALGYVGFDEFSDGSGYENVGNLQSFPFIENSFWSEGISYPIIPRVSPPDSSVYQFVDTNLFGFEPEVTRGELFAVVFKNESKNSHSDRIGVWAKSTSLNPDIYGWKFYTFGKTDSDTSTAYWYSLAYTFDFAVVVDISSEDCFIRIQPTELHTTISINPRPVEATIISHNPDMPDYRDVKLNYSTDNGSTWISSQMAYKEDNKYLDTIPGYPPGTGITYYISYYDSLLDCGIVQSQYYSYAIFQKQNDVLLLYNDAAPFSNNTAKALYVGYPGGYIIDPVPCDIWISADGTQEAAGVMALYNYVIQIDGQYPAVDFTDAAKEYLDGASAGDERNYLFSSQDYGCYITGDCSDITFTAGDFQYDYLGVETLGPQDLPGGIVGIEGVSGDPISGWVTDYESANSVGYFFDPSFELGFTSYIDALTPTSGATTTFTTDGQVCGVRNEGANWKTTFMTYDYAASNFRSDTSMHGHDDAGYAWGITVANQALKFLEWAEYDATDVRLTNQNSPDEFKLFQNYPNPFNPTTRIRWQSPVSGRQTLKVYDVLGKEVAALVNEEKPAGSYEVEFNASSLPSGVYFYQLKVDKFIKTNKMILLR